MFDGCPSDEDMSSQCLMGALLMKIDLTNGKDTKTQGLNQIARAPCLTFFN